MPTKPVKSKAGFTLMELIIVIVILGILALIAIPRLLGFVEQAKIACDKEYVAVVARSSELYWAANKQTVPDIDALVDTSNYVEAPETALQYFKISDPTDVAIAISPAGVAEVTITADAGSKWLKFSTATGYLMSE